MLHLRGDFTLQTASLSCPLLYCQAQQRCIMLHLQAGTVVLLLALGTIEVILLNPHMNKVRTEAWQAVGRLTILRMAQICH